MATSAQSDPAAQLALRAASGAVLAILALGAAVIGGMTFQIVVLLLALGVAWEWFRMTGTAGRWAACAAILAVWAALVLQGSIVMAVYAALMGAVGTAMFTLFSRGGEGGGWSAGGTLYATLPLAALLWIGLAPGGQLAIVWLFAVVWISDIGAFACGRTLKGPKLAPSISPAKTWSGAVGGLLTAALFGATMAPFLLDVGMARGAVLAALIAVAAIAGDLLESRIKRRFDVKDSGTLIPGHGGLLDRLDSLVVAAPAFALLVLAGAMAGEGAG